MERLNSLFALLLIVFLCSLAAGTVSEGSGPTQPSPYEPGKQLAHVSRLQHGSNGDCNFENGKTGSKWCKDAYKLALDNSKDKMFFHPKNTVCCLSQNMGQCVQYSFEKADCSSTNHEVETLVKEEVEGAKNAASKLVSSIRDFACGDSVSESKCQNLAEEFNKVKVKINELNGASTLGFTIAPFLAVACSVLALIYG